MITITSFNNKKPIICVSIILRTYKFMQNKVCFKYFHVRILNTLRIPSQQVKPMIIAVHYVRGIYPLCPNTL